MECKTKSIFPPSSFIAPLYNEVKSSIDVASAGITTEFVFSASTLIVPILNAIGAFVSTNLAPSSCACSATFHAIDLLSSAPNIIPLFPFKILFAIVIIYFANIKLLM